MASETELKTEAIAGPRPKTASSSQTIHVRAAAKTPSALEHSATTQGDRAAISPGTSENGREGSTALSPGELPPKPRRASVTWRKPSRLDSRAPVCRVAPDLDPVQVIESLGLRTDSPRALVKAIVTAVHSVDSRDSSRVEKALSAFNLASLLRPNADVASLAAGIAELTRSGTWPRMVDLCK
jgi:hypothetical protein